MQSFNATYLPYWEAGQRYIGVDPGLNGAVVMIEERGRVTYLYSHQNVKRTEDGFFDANDYIVNLPTYQTAKPPIVCIEQCMILRGQGAAAKIGINWGIVYASLVSKYGADNIYIVHPAVWKAATLGEGKHDKEESIAKALGMGFDVPTKRPNGTVLDDNMAEAFLLAHYIMENHGTS